MFEAGRYVVCGNKGVCVVEKITALDIAGVEKGRKYYILKPMYQRGSTVYVPVDAPRGSMRPVIPREEAERLVDAVGDIEPILISCEKLTEQIYREHFKTGSCEEWLRILKTAWQRGRLRIQAGRKMTAVDAKYCHMAEDSLYGELAVALGVSREEAAARVEGELEKGALHSQEKVL